MKYMFLIYENEAERTKMTKADLDAEMGAYYAFGTEAATRTTVHSSEALHDITKATTVRVRDGKTVSSDGPFAETKEQLGGYYVIECNNVDEAVQIAAMIPGAKHGSIEIRPVVVFG